MSKSKVAVVLLAATLMSGCVAGERLKNVGKAPEFTPIDNPTEKRSYKPVSIPMPNPQEQNYQPNSLWQSGARSFFKDQRAQRIGDILTVNIAISDKAEIDNETKRSRSNSEDAGVANLYGLENILPRALPGAVNPADLVDVATESTSEGKGSVDREEVINLIVAAYITQVLPNGNFVIFGRQEVRVNFEVRELHVTGIVRPEDITNQNTIEHTQIAEARIAYGGRGQITDVQQPRYGQQVFDIIMPF